MIDFSLAIFIAFIAIIAVVIFLDRKNIKVQGIVIIRRTKKGKQTIDKIASHKKFWGAAGILGVIIGIGALLLGSYLMISGAYNIVTTTGDDAGVKLLLPAPVASPVSAPGVFLFPWWIWVIGIAVVIIPHELFHGIMCRIDGIRITSVGWLLLVIIPGAFVEPDEKQLAKAPRKTKLRVYAAGSFANIITAAVIFLILVVFISPMFMPAAAIFSASESSAFGKNTTGAIASLGDIKVDSPEDISYALSLRKPGDTIQVGYYESQNIMVFSRFDSLPPTIRNSSDIRTETITLLDRNGTAYMGITPASSAFILNAGSGFIEVIRLIWWMFVFSLGIGIVNLLPIKPLDGGLIFEEITGHFTKRNAIIVKVVSVAMLLLLLFNIVGPIFL